MCVSIFVAVVDRLLSKDGLLIAEGYLFEFEARGYLQIGAYVPEVVLEHPELVRQMHHEFAHAGSDVILAFTVGTVKFKSAPPGGLS